MQRFWGQLSHAWYWLKLKNVMRYRAEVIEDDGILLNNRILQIKLNGEMKTLFLIGIWSQICFLHITVRSGKQLKLFLAFSLAFKGYNNNNNILFLFNINVRISSTLCKCQGCPELHGLHFSENSQKPWIITVTIQPTGGRIFCRKWRLDWLV